MPEFTAIVHRSPLFEVNHHGFLPGGWYIKFEGVIEESGQPLFCQYWGPIDIYDGIIRLPDNKILFLMPVMVRNCRGKVIGILGYKGKAL